MFYPKGGVCGAANRLILILAWNLSAGILMLNVPSSLLPQKLAAEAETFQMKHKWRDDSEVSQPIGSSALWPSRPVRVQNFIIAMALLQMFITQKPRYAIVITLWFNYFSQLMVKWTKWMQTFGFPYFLLLSVQSKKPVSPGCIFTNDK